MFFAINCFSFFIKCQNNERAAIVIVLSYCIHNVLLISNFMLHKYGSPFLIYQNLTKKFQNSVFFIKFPGAKISENSTVSQICRLQCYWRATFTCNIWISFFLFMICFLKIFVAHNSFTSTLTKPEQSRKLYSSMGVQLKVLHTSKFKLN